MVKKAVVLKPLWLLKTINFKKIFYYFSSKVYTLNYNKGGVRKRTPILKKAWLQ